jgi:hypothetical protein
VISYQQQATMTRAVLLFSISLFCFPFTACTPDDENGDGWNNLGRSCVNGYHADFIFNVVGGENLSFVSGPDEITLTNYSEGVSVTSTQLAYRWDDGARRFSAALNLNQRLESGEHFFDQLSEGTLTMTVDSNGTGIQQYQSSDFTLTVNEADYESLSFGSERLIHVEGTFTGNFRDILSASTALKTVNGSFCLHGHAE